MLYTLKYQMLFDNFTLTYNKYKIQISPPYKTGAALRFEI